MKKQLPPTQKKAYASINPISKVEEPEAIFKKSVKLIPAVKDFTFQDFKKFAEKTPFTQAEWASMLHVSERTLQRYAKNNGRFASINAERFYQINQVINRAKKVLGSVDAFYKWIHSNPPMLNGNISFSSLTTYEGIQQVLTQIGRIEHGILS